MMELLADPQTWIAFTTLTALELVLGIDNVILISIVVDKLVGMVEQVEVMIAPVIVSVALMMLFADAIGRFVSQHPTIKMLALAFLVLVGVVLIAAGFEHEIPKGYVYFAMAFSVGVELLNLRMPSAPRGRCDFMKPRCAKKTGRETRARRWLRSTPHQVATAFRAAAPKVQKPGHLALSRGSRPG